MAKRAKRLKKGIESLKEEIEMHFNKIEKDIEGENLERGRYHVKEIDRSLFKALELKMKFLELPMGLLENYRKRLEEIKKKIENIGNI